MRILLKYHIMTLRCFDHICNILYYTVLYCIVLYYTIQAIHWRHVAILLAIGTSLLRIFQISTMANRRQEWRHVPFKKNKTTIPYDMILMDTVLHCIIICYTVIQRIQRYYMVLHLIIHTELCYIILYYTLLCYTVLYDTILYYTVRYNIVRYYTVLCFSIPYYNILYWINSYCITLSDHIVYGYASYLHALYDVTCY